VSRWVSVKLKEETKGDLVRLAGAMQMDLKRDVSIDEVIRECLLFTKEVLEHHIAASAASSRPAERR
jgi:hypothetical protein